jgi:SagB-type dehydrogenase family enzyme
MKKIQLSQEIFYEGLSVEKAIEKRRSERDFSSQTISLLEFSSLLYYADGITEKRYGLRAAPSAGALYPIEIYPIVNNVEGLARGIYHYSVVDHSLELIQEGDFRQEMMQHALDQEMMAQASVVLVLTAVFHRTEWRYRERGRRYILLEAGHIAQNIHLIAVSMGLGSCAVGAFSDDEYNRMLGVDGKKESVIYLIPVGKI